MGCIREEGVLKIQVYRGCVQLVLRGESIIDYDSQLRNSDANSWIQPTHPLFTSFCIDDIFGARKINVLASFFTSEVLTQPPPCVRMAQLVDKIDY